MRRFCGVDFRSKQSQRHARGNRTIEASPTGATSPRDHRGRRETNCTHRQQQRQDDFAPHAAGAGKDR
jgi:hypothetical protein